MRPSLSPSRGLCWLLLGLLAWSAGRQEASAIDLREKSVSSSKQFIIYCTDVPLRSRVAGFAEEIKGKWLELLGESDRWKQPIILTIERAANEKAEGTPVALSVIQHETGFKIQIDVRIGADPAQVNLQKHMVRALFLEYAYRDRPQLLGNGVRYQEAPWWLVEGALQIFRSREAGVQTELFKRLVDSNRVPSLAGFLKQSPDLLENTTLQAVDQNYAMCLVQLLIEQPLGRANLASYVRHLPQAIPDPVLALQRDFPALSTEAGGAQKWWTLNLARLSAANRYKGLSPEETDAELASLLQFDIPGPKNAEIHSFGVADFDQYLKLPASKAILLEKQGGVLALSAQANAIYRETVVEYEQIFGLLVRGKTHGLKERLQRLADFRESLLRRKADIADYMNWFEATQMRPVKETTDGYIRAANQLAAPVPRKDPISKYLDDISQEF